MGKIYLRAPGHFVFIERVDRDKSSKTERERILSMIRTAVDKYFQFEHSGNERRVENF